jgi:predicted NBD/HSP70 family sugar kinase
MRPESHIPLTPRMEDAVQELQRLITARFPQAAFVVEEGADPKGIYLVTTVDIADPDEVTAVVGDRLVELQVDAGLPVYVTPLRPIARVVAALKEREPATPPSPLPLS